MAGTAEPGTPTGTGREILSRIEEMIIVPHMFSRQLPLSFQKLVERMMYDPGPYIKSRRVNFSEALIVYPDSKFFEWGTMRRVYTLNLSF